MLAEVVVVAYKDERLEEVEVKGRRQKLSSEREDEKKVKVKK